MSPKFRGIIATLMATPWFAFVENLAEEGKITSENTYVLLHFGVGIIFVSINAFIVYNLELLKERKDEEKFLKAVRNIDLSKTISEIYKKTKMIYRTRSCHFDKTVFI